MSRRGGSVAVYTKSGGGRKTARSVKSGHTNYVFKKAGDGRFELDMFKGGGTTRGAPTRGAPSRKQGAPSRAHRSRMTSGYKSSDPGGSERGRTPRTPRAPARSRAYSQTRAHTRTRTGRAESVRSRGSRRSDRSNGSRRSVRSGGSQRGSQGRRTGYTKGRTATRTAGGGSRYRESKRRSHSATKSARSSSTWRLPPDDRLWLRSRDVVACILGAVERGIGGGGTPQGFGAGSVYNSEFGTGKTGTRTLMNMRDTFQAGLDALEGNQANMAGYGQMEQPQPMAAMMGGGASNNGMNQMNQMNQGPVTSGRSRVSQGFGSGKTGTRTLMNMREAFQTGLDALGGSPSQGGMTPQGMNGFGAAAPMAPNGNQAVLSGLGGAGQISPSQQGQMPPMAPEYGLAGQNLDQFQSQQQYGAPQQFGGSQQPSWQGSQGGFPQGVGTPMAPAPAPGGTPMGSQPPDMAQAGGTPMGSQGAAPPQPANQ